MAMNEENDHDRLIRLEGKFEVLVQDYDRLFGQMKDNASKMDAILNIAKDAVSDARAMRTYLKIMTTIVPILLFALGVLAGYHAG